jgi:hypothetical protein
MLSVLLRFTYSDHPFVSSNSSLFVEITDIIIKKNLISAIKKKNDKKALLVKRSRTDNIMAKKKWTKGQATIYT